MPNLNKLAPQKTVYAYVDLRSTSQSLVQKELAVIKNNNLTFVESLTKLSPKTRKSSILCKALNYKARTDEDIVSQALLSLQQASIKYFEKDRDINFSQFAIISIRKGVYDYLNKKNHTNGSDLNEKIHTAIRTIKKSRNKIDSLTNKEAKHLALHFNLSEKEGIKKIYELEAIQLGAENDWKKNIDGAEYYRFDDQKNDIGNSDYRSYASDSVLKDVYYNQQKTFLKKQSNIFLQQCNKNEITIFKHRILCDEQVTLSKLSKILNVSFQMVSQIEKSIHNKFINFCKINLENNKNAGI